MKSEVWIHTRHSYWFIIKKVLLEQYTVWPWRTGSHYKHIHWQSSLEERQQWWWRLPWLLKL